MSKLQAVLDASVQAGDVPFAVAMVGDKNGIKWSGGAGERSTGQAASTDTVFRIFSMTKAVGSTAAMILIDRGKLNPDTPSRRHPPRVCENPSAGWLRRRQTDFARAKTKATVRNLATHTSGFEYEFWNSDVTKYLAVTTTRQSCLVLNLRFSIP
jgi:methyl acetate hydrolase